MCYHARMKTNPTPLLLVVSLLIAVVCIGCSSSNGEDSKSIVTSPIKAGLWRAAATVLGGGVVFHNDFTTDRGGLRATLVNAAERVPIREVTVDGRQIVLHLPAFNSTITLVESGGALTGTLTRTRRDGVIQEMPVQAVYAQGFMYELNTSPKIDVSGRWSVIFREDDGKETHAVGEFQQNGANVTGTFLTPTGDYRFLAGSAQGSAFFLSCFDGDHAFLFKARFEDDGSLSGDFWSGTSWHESWTAVRDEDATLPDPTNLTFIKAGYDGIEFEFPDVEGKQHAFPDPEYDGKVVIISLAGSWCPNCHDEFAFMSQFYREYHDQGLEAIGLMYEHFKDFARASQQVRHFAAKHDVGFDLLVAGYSDKNTAAETLPMLNHVMAFPTIIVIDRTGRIRQIHTGFSGPGTGAHYDAFVEEFTEFVGALLNER